MAHSQMKWQVCLYVNLKLPHLPTDMWIANVQQGDAQQKEWDEVIDFFVWTTEGKAKPKGT